MKTRKFGVLVFALVLVWASIFLGGCAEGDTSFTNLVATGHMETDSIEEYTSGTGTTFADNLGVDGDFDVDGATTTDDLTCDGVALVDGIADAVQLTVAGHSTQTSDLFVLEQSDGTDKLNVTNEGHVLVTVVENDPATTDYDEWVKVQGYAMGTGTKDRNYAVVIEMSRPAGQELQSGDHDEAGLKIRVDTEAVTTTVGTVLRGADIEAKADNPDGTVTNLYGASVTAKSDTSAGSVANMIALTTNSQANAEVTTFMASADLRLMRQSANEPTEEYVLYVRSDSTSGTGADAGIYVTSNYTPSATTDSMDYGLDMSTADINTADIRLENSETISNGANGTIDLTADVVDASAVLSISTWGRYEEQTPIEVTAGGTLTPTGTYQPITATASLGLSDITVTTAGDILILVNESDTTITSAGTVRHARAAL